MKILVVNNKWDELKNFRKSLRKHDFEIIDFHEIRRDDYKKYDSIILSWGELYEVQENPEKFRKELELIRLSDKPILGICLGLQMIAYAFWERLMKLDKYYKENTEVTIMKEDKIFKDLPEKFLANVDHAWCVPNPKNFDILAVSHNCIEAIKHKKKEIYWVQFHPEITWWEVEWYKVIENFLRIYK
jgi:GMP synthase (glutamine-hydrolysing)